jgi:GAF domain-containing protein
MERGSDTFIKLIGISSFLEQQDNLDECLDDLLKLAAVLLNVANCSIMLFNEDEETGDFRLRVSASLGSLPRVAYVESVKEWEGIAGHVAATGEPLLVEDIETSPYLPLARRPASGNNSFICVPILINRKVIGVINASDPLDDRLLNSTDLDLATFIALLVGKSIQVIQFQNILRSRFAQLALAREAEEAIQNSCVTQQCEAGNLAKILAKSFYREMAKAGLSRDHILAAATEIISILTENLSRHDRRLKRQDSSDPHRR